MNKIPYSNTRLILYFPCAPENVDALSTAAIDELKAVINDGISEADLAKVKEQQKRKLETELKQNRFWITSLHEAYRYGYNPNEILEKQKRIDALTTSSIRDVAKKYLNPNVFVRGVLMPDKDAKPLKGF